jgi:hypothetical protein
LIETQKYIDRKLLLKICHFYSHPSFKNHSERGLSKENGWLSISCIRPEDGQLCLVTRSTWAEPRLLRFELSALMVDWAFVGNTRQRIKANAADLLWIPADWEAPSHPNL